ncbi:MAG: tetratricopeptide repeat protein [Minicystis sp.]
METLFTWLHLSDLQIRAAREEGPAPAERLLAALRHDVQEHAGEPIEAILVTGDVAATGQRDEYVEADAFLVQMARSAGLGPERIYLVAGNHDVDRAADRAPLTAKLVAELRQGRRRFDAALEHARAREVLSSRLYAFAVFAATFGPPPADDDAPPEELLWWSHRVDARGGLKVRFVGLCTPFLAEGDGDRGALRLGEKQLHDAGGTIKNGELVVVLSHHPARGGWLADERDVELWLRDHAHVHVTGHPHDPIAEEARAGSPGPYVWVAAGATPAKRKVGLGAERKLGYSLVSVVRADDGALSLRIVPRRWSAEGNRFVADERNLPKGEAAAVRPLRLALPPPPPAQPSVPPGAASAQRGSSTPPPPAAGFRSSTPPPAAGFRSSTPLPAAAGLRLGTPPAAGGFRPSAPPPAAMPPAAAMPAGFRPGASTDVRPSASADFRSGASTEVRPSASADFRSGALAEGPAFGRAPAAIPPKAPAPAPVLPFSPAAAPVKPVIPAKPATIPPPALTPSDPAPRPSARSTGLFEGPGALPAMPIPLFSDRVAEIETLEELLTEPSVLSVVAAGPGGVGKTALVQHFVATRAPSLFDEGAWIDARDLPAELGRVAKRFGLRTGDRAPRVEEAVRFLRGACEGRRVLLVVDNLSPGVADARALPILGGASRVVVTSRILTLHEDLGRGARRIRLGAWDEPVCRGHLRALVPALGSEPDQTLDALARRVGGLPLAVRLLGRQLLRPDVTLAGLQLALDRDPLGTLDSAARGGESTLTSTFRPAFEALNPPLRRILVALAACAPETRADVVAEIAGVRDDEAALALEGFAEQSLVEHAPDAERPFRLIEAIRFFLHGQPGAAEAESTHEGLVLAQVLTNGADPRRWPELSRELPEVFAVVDRRVARGDAPGAWEVLKAVLGVLERDNRYGEFVAAARRILRVAAEGSETQAAVLADLGLALASLGDIAGARESLARALVVAEDHAYPETQALALGGLGRVHGILGELDKAVAYHRRAGVLNEQLGRRKLLAIDLGNVGLVLRRKGDVADAIEHLERALALYQEGEHDGRAEVLGGLGLCFRDIGELGSAIEYFQRALSIHEQHGRRAGQATMLGNLGNTYRSLGETDRAIEHLERALAIYEELGLPEGQGAALGNLGACYRSVGEPAKARAMYERALAVFRKLGLPDDHPHVRMVLGALGDGGRRARG